MLSAQDGTGAEFFEKRIRPILALKCYACHASNQSGGLRLDSRDALLAGGVSGPAIIPGKPDRSLIIRAVTQVDPVLRMPKSGARLSPQEITDLSDWIGAGAPWPVEKTAAAKEFWSFQPLRKLAPPDVKNTAWAKTPIDRFILAKLEAHEMEPARPADKYALIRRATFDLTGLPPAPGEVDAFLADSSPDAFAKVVDRLLASPHYGERWARHWLDVARYADGDGPERRPVYIGYGMAKDGYVNTFRYRDWVIDAFNRDLPYDLFVKAQIAADLLPEAQRKPLMPGLGFFGLGPWFTGDDIVFNEARANERDDKIDALSRGFLGLTVACARCHDHKYDPISQKDYNSLGGVFASSGYAEYNLAPNDEVERYQVQRAKVKAQEYAIEQFVTQARIDVAKTLAADTARYMMAVRKVMTSTPRPNPAKVAQEENLDAETLLRWGRYLSAPQKMEHPFLKPWLSAASETEALRLAREFQQLVLDVIAEKSAVIAANQRAVRDYQPDPNENRALLPGGLMQFELFQFKQRLVEKVMHPHRFYVWLDVVQGEPGSQDYLKKEGIYEYEFTKLVPFLTPAQKSKLNSMLAGFKALEKETPAEYPYLMTISDNPAPVNPRGLPALLGGGTFTKGSGRLEVAEAIVRHPLAARVMVNRIWMHHFGRGIVATPGNFGMMGERPTHPELLDYLASRFIENGWSIKAMHREIMLSATYRLSTKRIPINDSADTENKLLWRANLRRLTAEEIRDSLLFVAGALDEKLGGPPEELSSPENTRRTVYGRIRRADFTCTSGTGGVDRMLRLFDFPDATSSVDERTNTNVPLQGLFFLNSDLVIEQAASVAKRVSTIPEAYRLLFGRPPGDLEMKLGIEFLKEAQWSRYVHGLLNSSSFYYVN
jgi:hypothetical protein